MNFVLNRQPLGVEDLALGITTQDQTRGGATISITEVNASNIPYDAADDIKTVVDSKIAIADIGVTVEPADATILKDADIGVTVEPADATILKDADIGVSVQAYDATILKDADIGVTVEPADATILKDADIGVTVQAYDATLLNDADIGVSVQSYDADTVKAPLGILPILDGGNLTGLPSGFADPMTTRGDMIVRDATNVPARLGVGTAGQVLGTDGVDIVWTTNPAGVTDHTLLSNIGTNTHAQIDTHIADTTIHFTQASISITESQISDLGTYEPADATILKDADIGVTVQGYDANTTTAGNIFNGVSQLVQTDSTGKLPAIDGSLLTNLPSGGGTTSLLAEYVVGTTGVKSIDFSGLDINTHKSYRVEVDIKPDGEGVLCTYVNNTLTDTDYYTQRVRGDATSVSASRFNSPWVGFVYSGEISNNTINIRLCGDKYTFSNNTNKRIGSAQDIQLLSGSCVANFTNITQLTFTLGGSIDFSIGSKIRIYRGDV